MRKALVDVFIDDVRLVQDEIAFNQDGDLAVRVHHIDVFWLVIQINIANLEIHAFFEQDKTAAM
jgi:hypothetical protein